MKTLILFILVAIAPACVAQQVNDSTVIVNLLRDDYKTLEKFDIKQHLENCTPDYTLIENGEVLDLEKEIAYMKANAHRVIERKDYFVIHKLKVNGPIAYVIYNLTSEVKEKGETKPYEWVESAILKKIKNQWKIAMIHSTRLDAGDKMTEN